MATFTAVADDWFDYSNIGRRVNGTRFIPFKAPLMPSICGQYLRSKSIFTVDDLVSTVPNIGLIVDLTCSRYYDPNYFTQMNIEHAKLFLPGSGQLPSSNDVQKFVSVVKKFTAKSEKLIGVHCMHGINRTGFMICKYMIEELTFSAEKAVEAFENARGHRIGRKAYVEILLRGDKMISNEDNYSQKLKFESNISEIIGSKEL